MPTARPSRATRILVGASVATLIALIMWLLLQSNPTAIMPSYSWRVEGTVVDNSSNALAGAIVTAQGKLRFTTINLLFGTAEKTFHVQTTTDEAGHFALAFEGSSFTLVFSKAGYVEKSLPFIHYKGASGESWADTEQHLRVILDRGM
jgi:hypothetical protein